MKSQGGKWQPMFSRAGKYTVNQYIAFSESAHSKSLELQKRNPNQDEEDQDEFYTDSMRGERKFEIKKANKSGSNLYNSSKLSSATLGTSSFKAVSREKRELIFASKTNAPEVGKYKIYEKDNLQAIRKFNYNKTLPRKSKKGVANINELCDRLLRGTQNRENRLNIINKIFRKRGHRKYRFDEDKISKLYGSYFRDTDSDDKPHNKSMNIRSKGLDLHSSQESPSLEKSHSNNKNSTNDHINIQSYSPFSKKIKMPRNSSRRNKEEFKINLQKNERPLTNQKFNKTYKNNFSSSLKDKQMFFQTMQANSSIDRDSKMSFASTSFGFSPIPNKKAKFSYKNYFLSGSYHLVKNLTKSSCSRESSVEAAYSTENDHNFEIIPNNAMLSTTTDSFSKHIPTVNFEKQLSRKLHKLRSRIKKKKNLFMKARQMPI
ncbi:unnamed protein product [Moneuplotes crassus]|uniref:Uncharacterized protein n=1 Tax=Euplotes crassus TaxID=5936 RepID=A0AAD1XE60_EUPCR|nr:unnamed protein product [Moneuplotes crassus]